MKINSVTARYYEEYQLYLQRMRDQNLYQNRTDHERHIEKLKIESTQRARELDKNLGQNVDITI